MQIVLLQGEEGTLENFEYVWEQMNLACGHLAKPVVVWLFLSFFLYFFKYSWHQT